MRFDPSRPNNFDLLRFVAATLVLVDHSSALTGRPGHSGPFAYETLGGFAVAVFFIISGFLVAASWERAPRPGAFALKRALRIVPAYAAVVAFAALVLGPLMTELAPGAYFRSPVTWAYFRNLGFVELHYSLPGVFTHNPFPNAVNGSIWTLPIEVSMYIALAALGCMGLMTRPAVSVLVAALAVGWLGWGAEASAAPPLYFDVLPTGYTLHLALWFFAGSALWLWRERVRYRLDVAVALLVLLWWTEGTRAGVLVVHAAIPYLVVWAAQLPRRMDESVRPPRRLFLRDVPLRVPRAAGACRGRRRVVAARALHGGLLPPLPLLRGRVVARDRASGVAVETAPYGVRGERAGRCRLDPGQGGGLQRAVAFAEGRACGREPRTGG